MKSSARMPAAMARGVIVPVVALGMTASLLQPAADADRTTNPDVISLGEPSDEITETLEVTLITGDVVHWQVDDEGRGTALVEDKGVESVFHTIDSDQGYYVIPSEVEALVGTFLDRELFNVSSLVEQGYTDDKVNGVPVILQRADDSQGSATAPGLDVKRELSSINAVAGTLGRDSSEEIGQALALTAEQSSARSATAPAGSLASVEKIWLDGQASVSLEESVPQTGAPVAWEAGYDGTGMTIAILDTGIDLNHPDVADKIAVSQNFTNDPSVQDGHGHGTHVASTAAGTGAASDGLRKGVAPGADLAIGKVMDNNGDGTSSDIIAGMEWAASLEGVDVINMSIGGDYSDGTDPMSQALNELTEEYGVLFVTSAGNDGPGASTLTYPATADAALTVGAVDSDGEVAWFSSRGPRLGDYAIKPEITAPGVDITAARAAGTSMGYPDGDFYTSADGTSMAAPHVAGAVALLKQEHPDWTPEMLKAGLVNSARPNASATAFEQGGGELDMVQAIETTVLTTPSTLSMGVFEYPHDDAEPVTKSLTYTNHGEEPVSLTLEVQLADADGGAAPAGMLTVEPSTMDLAPGASADVNVTLDRTLGVNSIYSGQLTAMDADGNRATGTPVGFNKEPEIYDITVEGIERDGQPAAETGEVAIFDVERMENYRRTGIKFVNGVATVQVPPGTYSVMALLAPKTEDGGAYKSMTLMGDPELEVTEDVHLTLDARDAVEVTVDTPYDDLQIGSHSLSYQRVAEESGTFGQGWMGGDWPYYVVPTEPVTLGEFMFGTKFDMSGPGLTMNLAYPEVGALPADPSYEANETNTATIDTAYYSDVPDRTYYRAVPAMLPWEGLAPALYFPVTAPSERVEVFSANGTRFKQVVNAQMPSGGRLEEPAIAFEPGAELEQSWFTSPRTPSTDEGNEDTASQVPTSRLGNDLNLAIFEFGDSNRGEAVRYGSLNPFDDTEFAEFRVFQDGELYAGGERAFGTIPVDPESRLRFELDVHRETDWWITSTDTRTAWEFDSATTETEEPLPLLQVDVDVPTDLSNTVNVEGQFPIGLQVRMPYGVPVPEVTEVKGWLSYDDGGTWVEGEVSAVGGNSFEMLTPASAEAGPVSLKVEATDADGNKIEQEVIRAYVGLAYEAPSEPVGPESVERWSGADRFATAATAAMQVYPDGADVVYVATGRSHPDALAATAPAGHEDGPVLLTEAGVLPESTKAALTALNPGQIIVTGGPMSVSDEVLAALEGYTDGTVSRVSGADRYETAAALSGRFTTPETVFVATGQDYPDALAAGARAGMVGAPVLLVRQDVIPGSTADALGDLNPGNIVVVGGADSVSTAVLTELRDFTDGTVTRIAGEDRYETAADLSALLDTSDFGFVATGQNWPDALGAAALAGHLDSPVVLVRQDEVPAVTQAELERLAAPQLRIVGGPNSVGQVVKAALEALDYTK